MHHTQTLMYGYHIYYVFTYVFYTYNNIPIIILFVHHKTVSEQWRMSMG